MSIELVYSNNISDNNWSFSQNSNIKFDSARVWVLKTVPFYNHCIKIGAYDDDEYYGVYRIEPDGTSILLTLLDIPFTSTYFSKLMQCSIAVERTDSVIYVYYSTSVANVYSLLKIDLVTGVVLDITSTISETSYSYRIIVGELGRWLYSMNAGSVSAICFDGGEVRSWASSSITSFTIDQTGMVFMSSGGYIGWTNKEQMLISTALLGSVSISENPRSSSKVYDMFALDGFVYAIVGAYGNDAFLIKFNITEETYEAINLTTLYDIPSLVTQFNTDGVLYSDGNYYATFFEYGARTRLWQVNLTDKICKPARWTTYKVNYTFSDDTNLMICDFDIGSNITNYASNNCDNSGFLTSRMGVTGTGL